MKPTGKLLSEQDYQAFTDRAEGLWRGQVLGVLDPGQLNGLDLETNNFYQSPRKSSKRCQRHWGAKLEFKIISMHVKKVSENNTCNSIKALKPLEFSRTELIQKT